jgi:hypothetical protein
MGHNKPILSPTIKSPKSISKVSDKVSNSPGEIDDFYEQDFGLG